MQYKSGNKKSQLQGWLCDKSDMQDTVEDLDPAVRACETIDEWTAASEKYPAALDGADPIIFLTNRCLYGSFSGVSLCNEVNQ